MKHILKRMRGRRCSSQSALVLGVLLFLPIVAWAHFTIEFTDGTHINVSNYKEVNGTVKVYTHEGSFAFQKADIAKITETKPTGGVNAPVGKDSQQTPEPELRAGAERHQQRDVQTQQEKRSSPAPKISIPELPSTKEIVSDAFASLNTEGLFQLVGNGLYRLRYLFAVMVGVKVLKIFIISSLR